jgi:ATP-dependent phosphofructokinase / diphosphate-dependent phosphofructokinase
MDNDVPGTDYCIGFSTCVTRTIEMANSLRTVAGSHERLMVLEVFGRYAGFTAMLPTMAGAAHRCVIPEYKFNIERLAEIVDARPQKIIPAIIRLYWSRKAPCSRAAKWSFQDRTTDAFGHANWAGLATWYLKS